MIVRSNPSYFANLLALKGSILTLILPQIVTFFALSLLVEILFFRGLSIPSLPIEPMAGIGIALSLFLGFRNNAAYARWWEGRQLWGQVVGDTSAVIREINSFVFELETRNNAFRHLHKFIMCLASPSGKGAEEALDAAAGVLTGHFRGKGAGEIAHTALIQRLSNFSATQAGVERLKNTPLPFVYSLLIHRTVFVYCALLPFALYEEAGWFSPVITAVTVYVFLGLAAVTDCLEYPFSESEHAVPVKSLEAICKRKLETALAQSDLTPSIEVEDYVLR